MRDTFQNLVSDQERVFENLARRSSDLGRYCFIIESLFDRDVSTCAIYQRVFNGLYMLRRNQAWRSAFYGLLEAEKRNPKIAFRTVIEKIASATGRIEASFASKLVATVRPERPIYDSIVRQNLGLPERRGSHLERIEALSQDYDAMRLAYAQLISTPAFAELRANFDKHFPTLTILTDVKKLDFMLWQMR